MRTRDDDDDASVKYSSIPPRVRGLLRRASDEIFSSFFLLTRLKKKELCQASIANGDIRRAWSYKIDATNVDDPRGSRPISRGCRRRLTRARFTARERVRPTARLPPSWAPRPVARHAFRPFSRPLLNGAAQRIQNHMRPSVDACRRRGAAPAARALLPDRRRRRIRVDS